MKLSYEMPFLVLANDLADSKSLVLFLSMKESVDDVSVYEAALTRSY